MSTFILLVGASSWIEINHILLQLWLPTISALNITDYLLKVLCPILEKPGSSLFCF